MNGKEYMRLVASLSAIAITMTFTASVAVANDVCWEKADPALGALKTWKDLHAWHKNYSKCDDGYFGEGLSEFVVVSLARRWETLPLLKIEMTKNKSFEQFVLKHIDATTDENDLAVVIKNATAKCPSHFGPFCKKIAKKARVALKEIGE